MSRFDANDTGALESSYRDKHDFEYQTQTFQEVPLSEKVDNAGDVIHGARTVDGEEMRVNWEREQAIEHGVSKRPDERVDHDRQDMGTAMIERINGEQEELDRQYRKSQRASEADHDRARACREEVTSMDRQYSTRGPLGDEDTDAVPAPRDDLSTSGVSQHQPIPDERATIEERPDDPWSQLAQNDVAAVNKAAARLWEELGDDLSMDRGTLAGHIATRVTAGQSATSAMFGVKQVLETMPEVAQSISSIDPWDQYETTVEGEIVTLWDPKDTSQYQVGLIKDENGDTAKLTVWQASGDKPMLHEGDEVRVERAKVNAYESNGRTETTLAVDSDATIEHLSEGDGPARRLGMQSDDPTTADWEVN
jgi:hypothetical protein